MMHFLGLAHSTLCRRKFQSRKTIVLDQLNDVKLMEQLRKEKFDLAIGELFDSCYLGVLEHIGIEKHVTMLASAMADVIGSLFGVPSTPSQVPGKHKKDLG